MNQTVTVDGHTVTFTSVYWQHQAACRGLDPNVFFLNHSRDGKQPKDGAGFRPVKEPLGLKAEQTCAVCPVRAECLGQAIANREAHGVWGGLTPMMRAQVARHLAVKHTALLDEARTRLAVGVASPTDQMMKARRAAAAEAQNWWQYQLEPSPHWRDQRDFQYRSTIKGETA
jgi:WhiB family transcriptional regulator, redox-sensing transcriptional regulator